MFHVFDPLINHPSIPSLFSGFAVVSIQVASEPCSGSVNPKAILCVPESIPLINSSFCLSVPKSLNINTCGKFPTIELSFCKSLCKPNPLVAKCSLIIAIAKFDPSFPPNSFGSPNLRCPALSACILISLSKDSQSSEGSPSLSQSVLASSLL